MPGSAAPAGLWVPQGPRFQGVTPLANGGRPSGASEPQEHEWEMDNDYIGQLFTNPLPTPSPLWQHMPQARQ